jgi:hypothetical protein
MILRSNAPRSRSALRLAAVAVTALTGYACSGGGEQAGQPCETTADCYPDIDPAKLQGEVQCLDKVTGGYCTHLCETDDDCCAVAGECRGGHPQVCAPFESAGQKMCFLSCEAKDLGDLDEATFCQENAGADFGCRSTGGGNENRKICSP